MKHSFLNHNGPVVTELMSRETPDIFIADAKAAAADGADAIAIDLCNLKPEFRNLESLKRIIGAVDLPYMAILYRNDACKLDDDARQEILFTAIDAGACMVDVMGDLYDPSPMELTRNPVAIDKQKRLIDKIHAKGAEVVMSSHMQCSRTAEEVLEHLRESASRGADVAKIVTTVNNEEELVEAFRTTMLLKRELKTQFIHLCNGKFCRPHRFLGPMLGTSIMFAASKPNPENPPSQPTARAIRAVLDNMNWNIDDVIE